jgi:DNA-binding GntR family transcriptional regulator
MHPAGSIFQNQAGSTSELIAGALRSAILRGRYKANQPLRQDLIAEELGVSKIPLREALVQLKAEGLVRIMPKRGAVVSELSATEVAEIYAMRIALETLAIKKAFPRLRPPDLIRARSVLKIIDSGAEKSQWSDLNWEFHAILYQAADMPLLMQTIHHLHNNVARYLIIYLDRLSASDLSQKEHWSLLSACREKTATTAKNVLATHLRHASERLVAYLS